jgi:REP-associated tyrosine transposase
MDQKLFQLSYVKNTIIDLNMVKAGVVRHPGEWMCGGYYQIPNPKQRYSLINRQKLTALLGIKDTEQPCF